MSETVRGKKPSKFSVLLPEASDSDNCSGFLVICPQRLVTIYCICVIASDNIPKAKQRFHQQIPETGVNRTPKEVRAIGTGKQTSEGK